MALMGMRMIAAFSHGNMHLPSNHPHVVSLLRNYVKCCGNCLTATRDKLSFCHAPEDVIQDEVLLLSTESPIPKPVPGMLESQNHTVKAQVSIGLHTADL